MFHQTKETKVGVVGLGRVGLMTCFHLAEKGFSTLGVDIDKDLILQLNQGQIPFFEPGFKELLKKHQNKIMFSTDLRPAKAWFVAVPTPFDSKNKQMDLSFLEKALSAISNSLKERAFYKLKNPSLEGSSHKKFKPYVFIRSSLCVGGLQKLSHRFKNLKLAYMPEFFREGCFLEDYKHTKFSILACDDGPDFLSHLKDLGFPCVETCRPEEAELLKLFSNLFHGLKVSFANEVGRLAHIVRADPVKIMELFTKDNRLNVSKAYLRPGFSFSGPCLQKDIQSLDSFKKLQSDVIKKPIQSVKKNDYPLVSTVLPQSVLKSNCLHTLWAAERILSFEPKVVSLLGSSFTGNKTIDQRKSAVLDLAKILQDRSHRNLKILCIEKAFFPYTESLLAEESFEQLMLADVFVIGGRSPILKKNIGLFSAFQGVVFDLLIQTDLPLEIKKHPNYKNLYSL